MGGVWSSADRSWLLDRVLSHTPKRMTAWRRNLSASGVGGFFPDSCISPWSLWIHRIKAMQAVTSWTETRGVGEEIEVMLQGTWNRDGHDHRAVNINTSVHCPRLQCALFWTRDGKVWYFPQIKSAPWWCEVEREVSPSRITNGGSALPIYRCLNLDSPSATCSRVLRDFRFLEVLMSSQSNQITKGGWRPCLNCIWRTDHMQNTDPEGW